MSDDYKNFEKVSLDEARRHLLRMSLKPSCLQNEEWYKENMHVVDDQWHEDFCHKNNWFRGEIKLDSLVVRHPDFRHFPTKDFKNWKYVDFVEKVRDKIDAEEFPLAKEIKEGLGGDYPEIVVIYCKDDLPYVQDGQLRTITACYYNLQFIRVLIFIEQ